MRVLRTLKDKRDMSLNEVKLTVAIEDPTKREQKEYMGVEVAFIPVPSAEGEEDLPGLCKATRPTNL